MKNEMDSIQKKFFIQPTEKNDKDSHDKKQWNQIKHAFSFRILNDKHRFLHLANVSTFFSVIKKKVKGQIQIIKHRN